MLIIPNNSPELVELLQLDGMHVHAPTNIIFVCGGPSVVANAGPVLSLRDAFVRIDQRAPFNLYQKIYAENDTFYTFARHYKDWVQFETDIAEISNLVILFCESAGSLAELGLFVAKDEVAASLLIVIDDFHGTARSFVVEGCIEFMTRKHGIESVLVLHRADLRIFDQGHRRPDLDVSSLDLDVFYGRISAAVPTAIEAHDTRRSFNRSNAGHLIKLAIGLVQHYGALTAFELTQCFEYLDLPHEEGRIEQYMACAGLANWVLKERRGTRIFYAARAEKMAITYSTRRLEKPLKAADWRIQVAAYWEAHDPERFRSIQAGRAAR